MEASERGYYLWAPLAACSCLSTYSRLSRLQLGMFKISESFVAFPLNLKENYLAFKKKYLVGLSFLANFSIQLGTTTGFVFWKSSVLGNKRKPVT